MVKIKCVDFEPVSEVHKIDTAKNDNHVAIVETDKGIIRIIHGENSKLSAERKEEVEVNFVKQLLSSYKQAYHKNTQIDLDDIIPSVLMYKVEEYSDVDNSTNFILSYKDVMYPVHRMLYDNDLGLMLETPQHDIHINVSSDERNESDAASGIDLLVKMFSFKSSLHQGCVELDTMLVALKDFDVNVLVEGRGFKKWAWK